MVNAKQMYHHNHTKLRFLVNLLYFSILLVYKTGMVEVRAQSQSTSYEKWKGWTCDEIAPENCPLKLTEGDIPVRGGLFVHYWKYQSANFTTMGKSDSERVPLQFRNGLKLPLHPIVIIHGGPGIPHNYLITLKQLACQGREVIFYDQAGCGRSSLPIDLNLSSEADLFRTYPWLLDPLYYAKEELPSIIAHFNYQTKGFHLLGHSWGSILIQNFVLEAPPAFTKNLHSLVLSGPFSDSQLYIESQWDESDQASLGSLPPFVQERILALEANHSYSLPEYKHIDDALTSFFTVRTQPAPLCFQEAISHINRIIYNAMRGPSKFSIAGALAKFNSTARLHEISQPVLLTSGAFDSTRPSAIKVMFEQIPKAEWILLPKSAHCSMLDEPDLMNAKINDFHMRVEISIQQDLAFLLSKQEDDDLFPKKCIHLDEGLGDFEQGNRFSLLNFFILVGFFFAGIAIGTLLPCRKESRRHNRLHYQTIP